MQIHLNLFDEMLKGVQLARINKNIISADSNRGKIEAAERELAIIKTCLGMYQAEDKNYSFPSSNQIMSYTDLYNVLSEYAQLPDEPEAAWTFISYESENRDVFVLKGRAKDSASTTITINSPQ